MCIFIQKKKKNACKLSALTQSIYCRLQRLDHFFWEEINTQQEFCRVNSLQCLWRLHSLYGERMHRGYLPVNIVDGGCLLNPGTFFFALHHELIAVLILITCASSLCNLHLHLHVATIYLLNAFVDNNLPKTETRMRSFFEYWLPHWQRKVGQKPTQDELLKDFFKRSCYV